MSNDSNRTGKDRWDKLESLGKLIGGVSIPIIGFFVTIALHTQADSANRAELYANIMTEREKADSDIRAKMFDSLIGRYFALPARAQSGDFSLSDDEVTTLDLLLGNFQDYFDAEPLFYRLHDQFLANASGTTGDARLRWKALDGRLVDLARRTSAYQAMLLAQIGLTVDQIYVPLSRTARFLPPGTSGGGTQVLEQGASSELNVHQLSVRVALYPLRGLSNVEKEFSPVIEPLLTEDGAKQTHRYSIVIEVHDIKETQASVSTFLWEDGYDGLRYDPSRSHLIRKIDFNVSFFGSPYMDNTAIGGSRFALIYKGCVDMSKANQECVFPLSVDAPARAQFQVLTFSEEFLSQRDRPYLDQILRQTTEIKPWW